MGKVRYTVNRGGQLTVFITQHMTNHLQMTMLQL